MADIIKDLTEVSNFLCGENVRDQRLSSIVEDAIELLKQFRWTPVSERLPDAEERVLAIGNDNKAVVEWVSKMGIWHPLPNEYVTHWMPLPTPPEGGKQE